MTGGLNNQDYGAIRFRVWVYIAAGIFILGLLLGAWFALNLPEDTVEFFSDELAYFEELGVGMEPGTFIMFFFILVKNIGALVVTFALGPVLCLVPAASLLLNGALISLVGVLVAREESVGYVLAGLLPHGIIEIPAYIIGQAVAISMGFTLIAAIFSARKRLQLLPVFKTNARYMIIALILLVPAAAIETFLTPLLLD